MTDITTDHIEQFTLQRTGKAPLRFRGTLIASVNDADDTDHDLQYWYELSLYGTEGGERLVCSRALRSVWANREDQHEVAVIRGKEAVITFFGYMKLAQRLYAKAGFDTAVGLDDEEFA